MAGPTWKDTFSPAGSLRIYEELLVPRIFDPWAQLLVDHVQVHRGDRVVDVATGPGTVARAAAARVGPTGRVLGFDVSPAMVEIAREKPAPADGGPIEYRVCAAEALEAPDASADVVTCQQGVQFFTDRIAAVAEMRRVLRDGGRVGIAVWRSIEECPPFHSLALAVAEVLGEPIAARYRSGPWGFADPDALRSLLEGAGFSEVSLERRELPLAFEGGAAQLVEALASSSVVPEVAALDEEGRSRLLQAVARPWGADRQPIQSSLAANVVVATR